MRLEAERKEQQEIINDMRADRGDVSSKYIERDNMDDRIKELKEDRDRLRDVVNESTHFESTLVEERDEKNIRLEKDVYSKNRIIRDKDTKVEESERSS